MDKAVILLSGGMDSATLLHYVVRNLGVARVHALSFRYGQKHQRELDAAAWQARAAGAAEHRVVDLGFFGPLIAGGSALTDASLAVPDLADLGAAERWQPPTYVPNRNMVLLALAAAYAEAQGITDVFYGAQAQDRYGYWDCSREFMDNLNAVLALNRKQVIVIHAPFLAMRKTDELRLGLELGVDYAHTWTCYRGEAAPCGTCPSCAERAAAFAEAGVTDPLTA